MSKINFMEVAEKLARGQISTNDKQVVEAEKLLARMASTPQGLQEIAEVIAIYLDLNFNKFDIAPYLFQYRNFKLGDKPEFRLRKKGVKAYWIAPNSSTPKSRNYQETLGMEFDSLSVRPETLLDELKTGRIQGFAELLKDARDALEDQIVGKVFTLLGQVYNETSTPEQYEQNTSTLAQATVNKAIDHIRYKKGSVTVIGDALLTGQITDFNGYTEVAQEEIRRTGKIGVYRGANILSVPEVKEEASGKILVPKNKLFIVGAKIGYAGTYGDMKFGQESSIEDWSWNARFDKEWGATVTENDGLFVVEIV